MIEHERVFAEQFDACSEQYHEQATQMHRKLMHKWKQDGVPVAQIPGTLAYLLVADGIAGMRVKGLTQEEVEAVVVEQVRRGYLGDL